ncbi:MAG: cytochrome ubiquinol oxidase subunit I, partial [Bacteroidetes bacterium HGW-Bacteroidetes-20]
MIETIDYSLVDWSRAQFAMTAIIHWLFVPITIGITYVIAFAQTIHVKTGDPHWEKIAKFWAKLFGVNFAIGVGTGIILGLEFGTNWSNYSWISGDIFGAPLAAEGLMAFLLESTFIAVMFFGWGKLSKKFHLLSVYLVAIGASLSALWILVANAWMNYPIGMEFNMDLARHEMVDFWAVIFSPFAVNKFV